MPPTRRNRVDQVGDFFRVVSTTLRDVERKIESGFSGEEDIRQTIVLLQQMRTNVGRLQNQVQEARSLLDVLENLISLLNSENIRHQEQENDRDFGRVQGPRGPPSFDFGKEQLEHLLQRGFTVTSIADSGLLGHQVHRNTVYNHIRRHGLQSRQRMYGISDNDLRSKIQEYISSHPNSGYEEVRAFLTTLNPPVHVPRSRIRTVVAELDPEGVACRWRNVVRRRHYSVEGPNSIWHIDGHHKLVRYKIYVHGGIDGYSRLIPYLRCSARNTSRVAFESFVYGLENYGIPSRVRMDDGVENVLVRSFMEAANGDGRGSAIQGQSVHNQRIERLWRDVFAKVIDSFYRLFSALEDSGALDVNNNVHLFCLQFVFIPIINLALEEWRHTHNNHKVRTERYRTPEQLWLSGVVSQRHRQTTAMNNLRESRDIQAISCQVIPDFSLEDARNPMKYNMPRICQELPADIYEQLGNMFNRQYVTADQGLEMYADVLAHVMEALGR